MGQRRDDLIRLAPIEFLLQQAEYSSRHSQRVAGQRWGQVGRNEGCEFHRLRVGRLSRNAPAVVEDPSHEKRELCPQVHGLFRRQAIAQDVQHRSQRPVSGPMITAGGYTTKRRSLRLRRSWPMPSRSGGCSLPQRIRAGVPLNAFDRSTAYGGGAHGYSCSPLLAPLAKAAGPFFATIAGYCRLSHDNPVVRAAKSPRPWRPADAAEGGPSVMLRFDLPDGRVVLAEIAARLYVMTGRMIGARYPIED